jgi:hypothetical protein
MEVTLKLTVDEVNFVLQAIGQLPTSSGSWPLLVKIRDQAQNNAVNEKPKS